ncbi:ATP-binding protein [Actinomadura craniellae]|uniref:ATP-binding protein n=1 Tax=Actinomadura craniellae TaxID=2231787 RepID=A0A365HBZ1_9ACTN|nr:ATP-binding protein [Actinomadura craniellae]RAY16644.1 ATP-binding protein [Actinomadura craniellae]
MILDQADDLAASPTDESRHWWLTTLAHADRPAAGWPTPPSGNPRTARRVLRAAIGSPRAAREFTRDTLAEWDLTDLFDDLSVVVSELVTNALRHGLGGLPESAQSHPVQLVLLGYRRRLVVVVTDPGERVPEVVTPEQYVENGRGLRVVEALSTAWGWAPLPSGGKAVWSTFDLPHTSA